MTGTTTATHGDRVFKVDDPMPPVPTLAQTFRDNGYQAYAVGKLHVSGRMVEAERRFRSIAAEVADVSGVEISITEVEMGSPCPIDGRMQDVIAQASTDLGLSHDALPSGAGHDAQAMAAIAQSGMIFVPSRDGISHSPEEFTPPQDCANGANTLLSALLLLDKG